MFYSDTLLSKNGPLGRVWMSANIERKVSKTHVLQSDIESSVNAIVDPGQAPLALRLSGQLLLGVVRIYSRKTRYLMDDCNEALLKIKMAFRPGTLDLLPAQDNMPNPTLTVAEVLTEPMNYNIDESIFDMGTGGLDFGAPADNNALNWTSQLLSTPRSTEKAMKAPEPEPVPYDDDLGLIDYLDDEPSIEVGRDAPPARPAADDLMADSSKLLPDDDFGLDFGDDEPLQPIQTAPQPFLDENGMDIDNPDNFRFGLDDTPVPADLEQGRADPQARNARLSDSPLSSARSSVSREVQQFPPAARQSKRRRLLKMDNETMLHSSQIKQQQLDRSSILKPLSLLPKDPVLLALMEMQRNGTFVSSIMDGQMRGLAPELRGILSIEVVRASSEKKRKRDSGVADVDEEDGDISIPQIEVPPDDEEELPPPQDEGVDLADDEIIPGFEDEAVRPHASRSPTKGTPTPAPGDNFDDTTLPLIPLDEQGPISLGTQHAVHLLRDHFSGESQTSPSKTPQQSQRQTSVRFQDLLPEATTSRADATKMFFEVLVLATKDAIKVEQKEGLLGGDIRIRGKRGLWGSWAERAAGGEIASQAQEGVAT